MGFARALGVTMAASDMQIELTHFIDAFPGLAWTALPDGRAEFLNRRWLDYTGLTVEQAADLGWIEAIHPSDRARVGDYWRSCVISGSPGDTEARMRRHDGIYRWFLFHANPVRNATGNISRWFGTNIDIEDRRRGEEALQSNERNLSLIINTIPAHIYVLNTEGFVQYVNQAVMDYTGLTLEDVQQEDYRDRVIHPEDFKRVRAGRAASLRRGAPFSTEQRVLGNDGQYRWFLVRYKPLLNEQGRIVRWYVAAFDIEDRKRAVDQLQLLANMMHLIPAAVWSMTPDGTPDVVNQGWYDYTGQTPEYVHSGPEAWMSTVHPDDAERTGKIYWEGIRSGTGFTMEARFLRASDRTYRWHLNRAVAVRDPAGNITRFVGTSTDIEDLKTAQDELHDARAALAHVTRVMMMGELTASIAHEINQPLAGIITNANTCLRMLAADQPNVEGACETARRAIRDANRASEVIAHLRALFAKKETAAEHVDLTEATKEVIALCSTDLQRKGTLLRQELAGDLPVVVGDRIQLQQVILNLLTNAADALLTVNDRPRELRITTALDADGLVRVTVCDNGVGFDASNAEKLFKAFFTTKSQGMGIGLSVSRSIIESHHGRIWAVKNAGPGATFAFAIPRGPIDTPS
jgi:PAS domain S-box-containing protein